MKNLSRFLLLCGLFFTSSVFAQPEFDTTFASAGRQVVDFAVGTAF